MIGARIAALRRSFGMSQAELAKQLMVSPSAVGMYEQGRREPAAETLVALGNIFGVSTDYLLKGTPTDHIEQKKVENLILRNLSEHQIPLQKRDRKPFTRQELMVLFTAMLLDT